MPNCDDFAPRLTAYLHHELHADDCLALERHLESCGDCRALLQRLHDVARQLKRNVLQEPTAGERRELENRLEKVLVQPPPGDAPAAPRPEPWRVNASAPPPALTFSPTPPAPLPALPPLTPAPALPAGPSSGKTPDPPAGQASGSSGALVKTAGSSGEHGGVRAPAGRPGSSRSAAHLTATSVRIIQARERRLLAGGLTLALVLALGAVLAWQYGRPPQQSTVVDRATIGAVQRWTDRVRARDRGEIKELLLGETARIELPGEPSDGALWLLPHEDPATQERLLVLYRAADVERLQTQSAVDAAELARLLEHADRLGAERGAVTLPAQLKNGQPAAQYLDAQRRLSLLAFADRIELWPAPRLQAYLARDPSRPGSARGAENSERRAQGLLPSPSRP